MDVCSERFSVGTKLYVGNLNFQTTEADLRAAFEADGRQVSEVAVISDRATGRPRGFAFVRMATEEHAKAAIAELDGKELDGRDFQQSGDSVHVGGRPAAPACLSFGDIGLRAAEGLSQLRLCDVVLSKHAPDHASGVLYEGAHRGKEYGSRR